LGLPDQRIDVVEELFRDVSAAEGSDEPFVYFHIQGDKADVATKIIGPEGPNPTYEIRSGDRRFFKSDESIFTQRKEPQAYPDLAWLAQQFAGIYSFREWAFGHHAQLRLPQSTAMPTDTLLPDASNLALFLQETEHIDLKARGMLNEQLRRFLPRFERLSTRIGGGTIQLYLHESGSRLPIPAQRLSDGTLRIIAMLAALLTPKLPPLICLEEPELGQHPDAMTILAELLVEVSARTQIVVTTHSEALLSRLSDASESLLVCEHLGDTTAIERLDADKLKFWLDKYTLGEIWRIGELGGNP
jgi:predicted ATPase